MYFWDKFSGELVNTGVGDEHGVLNCILPHNQNLPFIATSGLDSDVKLWSVTSRSPDSESYKNLLKSDNRREIDKDYRSWREMSIMEQSIIDDSSDNDDNNDDLNFYTEPGQDLIDLQDLLYDGNITSETDTNEDDFVATEQDIQEFQDFYRNFRGASDFGRRLVTQSLRTDRSANESPVREISEEENWQNVRMELEALPTSDDDEQQVTQSTSGRTVLYERANVGITNADLLEADMLTSDEDDSIDFSAFR